MEEVCGDDVDNDCDGASTGCGPWGSGELAESDARLLGTGIASAGISVTFAGDVNGDGATDLLVGAWKAEVLAWQGGAAYLVTEPPSGSEELTASAVAIFSGESTSDRAGLDVAAADDLDADGYADLWVNAYAYDGDWENGGGAFSFLGPLSGTLGLSSTDGSWTGWEDYANAAYTLSSAGDVDGDGAVDALFGSEPAEGWAGAAHVVLAAGGRAGSLDEADITLSPEGSSDHLGAESASLGDMNGDGMNEIAVGALCYSGGASCGGAAYVLSDPPEGSSSIDDVSARIASSEEDAALGSSIDGAGDINADGYDDMVVGAPYESSVTMSNGAAFLFLGPLSAHIGSDEATLSLRASEYGANLGTVGSGEDLDGDGALDLAIGAWGYGTSSSDGDPGRVYVVPGPLETGSADIDDIAEGLLVGNHSADYAGWSLDLGSDVNGDGVGDLLVGAKHDEEGGSNAGAAYLVLGGAW